MFTWNTENVLAAIDAGIVEVIATYNSSFLFAIRDGYNIKTAYTIAMSMTILWLKGIEKEAQAEKVSVFDLVDAMAYAQNGQGTFTN